METRTDGDIRQNVRHPPALGKIVAPGNSRDFRPAGRRLLTSSDLAVDATAGRQRFGPATAQPSRVTVDETAVQIDGDWCWDAAIDLDTMLVLDIEVFSRYGTDPAAAFLHRFTEKHNLEETTFLVDGYGYSTAIAR